MPLLPRPRAEEPLVGLTRKGKGTKVQLVVDAKGVPLALSLDAASVGETAMVQQTLGFVEGDFQPKRLIGDKKGYDSDALDQTLAELGIEMISPHRSNRRPENLTQDGRPLRRYRRRWIVERTIAWLGNHRRLSDSPRKAGLALRCFRYSRLSYDRSAPSSSPIVRMTFRTACRVKMSSSSWNASTECI